MELIDTRNSQREEKKKKENHLIPKINYEDLSYFEDFRLSLLS